MRLPKPTSKGKADTAARLNTTSNSTQLGPLATQRIAHTAVVIHHPSRGLDLRAFQPSIFEAFVLNVSESGWNHDLAHCEVLSAFTIRAPLALISSDNASASCKAWQAYCSYVYGKKHRLHEALTRSRLLCSEAVKALYSIKWDGHSIDTGMEIIAAATFLSFLEIRSSSSPRAWLIHNAGVLDIITRLGPKAFTDPLRLRYLESSRHGFVFTRIIQSKFCPLEEDAWLTVPWSSLERQEDKAMEQQLMDIILTANKGLRNLLVLHSAPDFESFKDIMSGFWSNHCNVLQAADAWKSRHYRRLAVADWSVYPPDTPESIIFPDGVPLFEMPIAALAMSWYYILLHHLNAVAAYMCVLMSEMDLDVNTFHLDEFVHWLWVDQPETEQDILSYMYHPGERSGAADDPSHQHFRTLWLAMADRLLELSQDAAILSCAVITPIMDRAGQSLLSLLGLVAFIPTINTFGDGIIGVWARDKCLTLFGGQVFKDMNELKEPRLYHPITMQDAKPDRLIH